MKRVRFQERSSSDSPHPVQTRPSSRETIARFDREASSYQNHYSRTISNMGAVKKRPATEWAVKVWNSSSDQYINRCVESSMSAEAQLALMTILFEDYSIEGTIYSYVKGEKATFCNFKGVECIICREDHENCWSLSNDPRFPQSTLAVCHKYSKRAVIHHHLPIG